MTLGYIAQQTLFSDKLSSPHIELARIVSSGFSTKMKRRDWGARVVPVKSNSTSGLPKPTGDY
jgi:hypothetical protein